MILLVGEAPNKKGGEVLGNATKRIAELIGMDPRYFRTLFGAINLLTEQQAKSGKGKGFDYEAASKRIGAIESQFMSFPVFILLGKRVGKAFGFQGVTYFEWKRKGERLYAVVPHPSGVNRWFNRDSNAALFTGFFQGLLPMAGYR